MIHDQIELFRQNEDKIYRENEDFVINLNNKRIQLNEYQCII
jgi:hypothetical protein